MTDALPIYELYAIRYAYRDGLRSENFIGGDKNDGPMPMDYFVWVAISPERTFVIDTALSRETAEARKRTFLHSPIDILAKLGVDAKEVKDVILTHLHNDHTGFIPSFPKARFHLQESELHFAVGHYMAYPRLGRAYVVDDVLNVVRLVHENRVKFYFGGDAEAAPGITLHHVGGHTAGQMFVRVHTKRGWVVVANDVTHFYENMESGRPFAQAFNVGDMLDGFGRLLEMAPTKQHIVAGHDPLVMQRYPAPSKELEGIVVRLDVAPSA